MIKVIHICTDSNIGGAGKYLSYLLKFMDYSQFEITLVVPKNSDLLKIIKEDQLRIIEGDYEPDKSFDKQQYRYLKKLIRQIKPDIVHTHASFAGRLAAKFLRVDTIVYTRHFVDEFRGQMTKGIKNKLKKFINNWLCTGVIAVADECVPVLIHMGIPKRKIRVIRNGVERLQRYPVNKVNEIKSKYKIPSNYKVITILARLSIEKGHNTFIQSIKELHKERENMMAIVAGSGVEKDNINKMIVAEGLEDVVKMVGFVTNVEEILNISDILVNTSITEAQSLSLSEGMSIGVPAVAVAVGGNCSMIRDYENGLIARPNNYQDVAAKMKELLDDEMLYNSISSKAIKVFEENYNAEIMARKTEEFYKELKERK